MTIAVSSSFAHWQAQELLLTPLRLSYPRGTTQIGSKYIKRERIGLQEINNAISVPVFLFFKIFFYQNKVEALILIPLIKIKKERP